MTVGQLIDALSKAKHQDAEVDIIDRNGDEIAASDEITVDEDGEGSGEEYAVHLVVECPKL